MRNIKNLYIYIGVIVILSFCFFSLIKIVEALNYQKIEKNYNQYQVSQFITDIQMNPKIKNSSFMLSDTIELKYNWSIKNQKKDDLIIYEIPEEIYIVNDLNFNLLDNHGKNLGKVQLDSKKNQMEIRFDDPDDILIKGSKLVGSFFFTVKLNPEFWRSHEQEFIKFSIGEKSKEFEVNVIPEEIPEMNELLYGWGMYNKNEETTDWMLRVNHAKKSIRNGLVKIEIEGTNEILPKSLFVSKKNTSKNDNNFIDVKIVNESDTIINIYFEYDFSSEYFINFSSTDTDKNVSITGEIYENGNEIMNTIKLNSSYTIGESLENYKK